MIRIGRKASGSIYAGSVALSALVGLGMVPIAVRLGEERTVAGLALAWAFMSLTASFDLGLGRSIARLSASETTRIPTTARPAVTVGLLLQLAIGSALGLAFAAYVAISEVIGLTWLQLFVVCVAMPGVTVMGGSRYVFEATNHVIRSAGYAFFAAVGQYVLPVCLLVFGSQEWAVVSVVLGRGLLGYLSAVQLWRENPWPGFLERAQLRAGFRGLGRFTGWVVVSSVLGIVAAYLDKWVVPFLFTLGSAAAYLVIFDLVLRIGLAPAVYVRLQFRELNVAVDLHGRASANQLRQMSLAATIFGLLCVLGAPFAGRAIAVLLDFSATGLESNIASLGVAGMAFSGFNFILQFLFTAIRQVRTYAILVGFTLPILIVGLWAGVLLDDIRLVAVGWAARAMVEAWAGVQFLGRTGALGRTRRRFTFGVLALSLTTAPILLHAGGALG